MACNRRRRWIEGGAKVAERQEEKVPKEVKHRQERVLSGTTEHRGSNLLHQNEEFKEGGRKVVFPEERSSDPFLNFETLAHLGIRGEQEILTRCTWMTWRTVGEDVPRG